MSRMQWVVILSVAAALTGGYFYYTRDAAQINRAFKRVVQAVNKEQGESVVISAAKARLAAQVFSEHSDIQAGDEAWRLSNRTEIQAALLQLLSMVDSVAVRVHDQELSVDSEHGRASMQLTARATVSIGGSTETLTREFQVEWEKTEEGWLMKRAWPVEAIRAP